MDAPTAAAPAKHDGHSVGFNLAAIAIVVAVGAVGLKMVFMALLFGPGGTLTDLFARLFIGVGLVSGFVGGGALLLMAVSAGIRMFGHYARLHFRLAQPDQRVV